MKDYRNTIWKILSDECYLRLAECRLIIDDLPKLVNSVWAWWREQGKANVYYTKEDAVIYVMELLDANSQGNLVDDLTIDEFNELVDSILV